MMFALKVWSFLKSPWGERLLIGLVCIGLVVGFAVHERQAQAKRDAPWITDPDTKARWKDEAQAAVRDLGTCHSSLKSTMASLDAQNAAVGALRAESDARLARSVKAASDARSVAESFRRNASAILGAKAGVDQCASAEALIGEATR